MRKLLVAVALAAWLGSAPAGAELHRWDFAITEDQVRNGPGVDGSTDSAASGWGHLVYDTLSETLDYTISWQDLDGDLTKLHIHGPAEPGENNPNHLFEIFNTVQDVLDAGVDPRTDRYTGQIQLDASASQCTDEAGDQTTAAPGTLPCFLENLAYVNVHTESFPMGEIRGNLVLQPDVMVWAFDVGEDQVQNGNEPDGSTDSPARGRGSFRYDRSSGLLDYTIGWDGLEGDLTKLHIHGPAGADASNPNHLFEIFNTVQDVIDAGVDPRSDAYTDQIALDATATECSDQAGDQTTAAPGTLPCLLEHRAYVNVHTEVDPMGEIRGNLALQPLLVAWSFPIGEDQVKNGPESDGSTDSPATGSGTFRYDPEAGLLHYRIAWDGLLGDLTKLHIHGPAGPDESNPNHLFEIFNTVQDVIDAGVDPRSDAFEGSIALDVLETECSDDPGTQSVASPGSLPCFLEGSAYVNVHTEMHPMGEIRGNLTLAPHPYLWDFPIREDQVKNGDEPDGSTDSPATGRGVFRYDANTGNLAWEIGWEGLEGGLTKLHIHGPADAESSNPNHLFEIFNTVQEILDAGVDRFDDTVFGDIALDRTSAACTDEPGTVVDAAPGALPCFLEERAYVNVHSEQDPTGEIRGNLRLLPEPRRLLLQGAALVALCLLRRPTRTDRRRTTRSAASAAALRLGSGTRRKV